MKACSLLDLYTIIDINYPKSILVSAKFFRLICTQITNADFPIHQRFNVLVENCVAVPFDDSGGNCRRSYCRYRYNNGDDFF